MQSSGVDPGQRAPHRWALPIAKRGDAFSRDGDNEDHFAVEMAPPAKRGRVSDGGKVPRQGCKKVNVKSDDNDDDEVDDAFLADVDELLKGGNIDPLHLNDGPRQQSRRRAKILVELK